MLLRAWHVWAVPSIVVQPWRLQMQNKGTRWRAALAPPGRMPLTCSASLAGVLPVPQVWAQVEEDLGLFPLVFTPAACL